MAGTHNLREGEMAVDEALGYPRAYAKLCNGSNLFNKGPPFEFHPYPLHPLEIAKAEEFERMFPTVESEKNSTVDLDSFIDLLWRQLTHLANAGFDPSLFRVDPYGNVLYFHADSSSPLSWKVDHWFPQKRGGKTVISNLRLVQSHVFKAKKNKLEFLVPWWDLQLGISVNQFLSIFASRNSDYRKRGFSFLFTEREDNLLRKIENSERLFPQQFIDKKCQIGLAPAAISSIRKNSEKSVLKSVNPRRQFRPQWPSSPTRANENENPNMCSNEYLSIAMARDSLKAMEESKKKQAMIRDLDDEANDLSRRNEEERIALGDLELALIRKRRRVEKCRRLAEAQASYRDQLDKMMRGAMHQCVVYKEQARLNQAACHVLASRLEAQKAMCETSERELSRREKIREELETQTTQKATRKRPLEEEQEEEEEDQRKMRRALKKELRVFLEEEQKASQDGKSFNGDFLMESEEEERTSNVGRRNVEKWLRIFLEKSSDDQEEEKREVREGEEEEDHFLRKKFKLSLEGEKREVREEVTEEDPFVRKKFKLSLEGEEGKREVREREVCRSVPEKRREESPRSSRRISFGSSPLVLKKGIDKIIKKTIRRER